MKPPPKRREALTQARRPAPVATWGAAEKAGALAKALDVGDAGESAIESFTHRFHSYPARMHPLTARRALAKLALPPRARLIDPFCGSGTVLVEAVRVGLAATGVDASPLALLVAAAKTWAGPAAARKGLVGRAHAIRDAVLAQGKAARRAGYVAPPPLASDKRRQEALAGWFDPHVRRELEAIRAAIGDDELLRAILSSVLIKVSRRASDTRAEVAPRTVARGFPARIFADRAEELSRGLDALWKVAPTGTPPVELRGGDARALPFPAAHFDAVLTSPPYVGTYDYAEQHELRLAFLGVPGAKFDRREIGARRSFIKDSAVGLAAWERDLASVLEELGRVVKPGGPILVVVGDSLAGGQAVYADKTLERLAPAAGLDIVAGASAERMTLGAAEGRAFSGAPKREHLIWLARSASDRPRPPRRSPSA